MRRTIEFLDKHPLNTSKTKEAHAFSKSPRFNISKQPQCRTPFYDLSKSAIQLRKKSPVVIKFPRQKRFLEQQSKMRNVRNTPSPLSYSIQDYFMRSRRKNKGIPFAQSPKSRNKVEYLPGPATYEPTRYNPQHIQSVFISNSRSKINTHWNKLGPGEYNSKPLSRSAINIKIGNAKRFDYKIQQTPSPHSYNKLGDIVHQTQSYQRSPKFSFAKSPKTNQKHSKQTSPGPGSYNNSFSQFSERSKRIYQILKRL